MQIHTPSKPKNKVFGIINTIFQGEIMELVYLWVEDYKNIHKQGFNFSPRFRCHYDEDKNELTIDENDDYIENFFGENINVTAIAGKNGSGKSSILRELTWQHILININDKFYAKGFPENSFDNLPDEFFSNIIYINYDLMQPYEFRCFSCHQIYPSNNNLYKLVENSKNLKNIFNTEMFYRSFQYLILEYANIFKTNIFSYSPAYVYLYINNKDSAWENEIKEISGDNTDTFIHFLKENSNSKIDIEVFYKYYLNYKDFFHKIDNKNIRIDIYDNIDRKYFHLSQGERKIFTELLMMYSAIDRHKSNNLLLVLDEPDLTLHPDWQKKYFKELIVVLKSLNKNLHLIITTHSPFLLSDIPKQNIIFLDKDENGNCKVVDGLNEKKETFGANIHTLLSDSFFMEDGLMGEFAKGKINEIIEFHKKVEADDADIDKLKIEYKSISDKLWQTQSIVGDDYLKQVLKNHLVEIEKSLLGKDRAKELEIERTEAYLEALRNG